MPNRFLFGVAFDRPGSRGEAFCFQNKQSLSLERMSSAKLQVRHILFKKIRFLIFLSNRLTIC